MIFQKVELYNVQEVQAAEDQDGWKLCRVPLKLWQVLNPSAQRRAFSPAGAEVRFNLNSESAKITLKYIEDRGEANRGWPVLAELHFGDFYSQWVEVKTDWTEIIIRRPPHLSAMQQMVADRPRRFDPALVRVVLPYMPEIRLKAIEGEVAPPNVGQLPLRRYLAYGSSITNGAFVTRPGDAYPARVARDLRLDLINLGFGAGAFLEPAMAQWIADRSDWDLASLELGTNLLGRISVEEFAKRIETFLTPIAALHPEKWIFCIDLFSATREAKKETEANAFRAVVRESLQKHARPKWVYVDGRRLLPEPSGLILDFIHPSSEGAEAIAQNLTTLMRGLF